MKPKPSSSFGSEAPFGVVGALSLGVFLGTMNPLPAQTPPLYKTAPEGVVIERDVASLPADRPERLDLYLPANRPAAARSPGVVIIHGGGWVNGSKAAEREYNIGTTLARAGYVCASVEYRLAAHERWPTNVYGCKNAVRFLRANAAKYNVDPGHIGMIGGSAGGHLALMVGLTDEVKELEPPASLTPYPGVSDRVQSVVDMYGITDLRTSVDPDKAIHPGVANAPRRRACAGGRCRRKAAPESTWTTRSSQGGGGGGGAAISQSCASPDLPEYPS